MGSLAPRVYDRLVARILLATDGSAEAEAATQVAVEQAKAMGSELHVVYVGRLPNFLMQDPDVGGLTASCTVSSSGILARGSGG